MSNINFHKLIKKPSEKLIDALIIDSPRLGRSDKCPYSFLHESITTKKRTTNEDRLGYIQFLKVLANQKAEVLDSIEYVKILPRIYEFREHWLNPINTWVKRSRSRDRQMKSIIDHLFVNYEMPTFMYNAWYTANKNITHINWFIDIGAGKNIRKSKGLPFPFTKKMAHTFLQSPDYLTPDQACWYAKGISIGADERTVKGFLTTAAGRNNEWYIMDIEFTESLIRWFANNPMLEISQYNPIVDYITDIKYSTRYTIVNRRRTLVPPEKPNFSMKDRDPSALLSSVDKWHVGTRKGSAKPATWMPYEIDDYTITTGSKEHLTMYTFKQLTTSNDLAREGRALGHCVGSYTSACSAGRCSIWSLRVATALTVEKSLVTIELTRDRLIAQVRGKANRFPNAQELRLIEQWASAEGFSISRWIKA